MNMKAEVLIEKVVNGADPRVVIRESMRYELRWWEIDKNGHRVQKDDEFVSERARQQFVDKLEKKDNFTGDVVYTEIGEHD